MKKLLMIADDLTGALDAGVCFAEAGINTCVCQDTVLFTESSLPDSDALVCVADTRHVSPEDAYTTVYRIVTLAKESGFTYIFKKTDSALRGNVGAELAAARDAAMAKHIYFVPAFPKMNRITQGGIQYIDGSIPVSESVFGKDPLNPVRHSSVLDILKETTSAAASLADMKIKEPPEGILVFDAATEQEVRNIAEWILSYPDGQVLAGCAGLASVLPQQLDLHRNAAETPLSEGNLLVFCGSVNPISLAQCQDAKDRGAPYYHLIQNGVFADPTHLAKQISASAESHPLTVFDTGSAEVSAEDPVAYGKIIAEKVGQVICKTAELVPDAILGIIGGDTLLEFLRQRNIETIYPLRELFPGVVLASYFYHGRRCCLISKSGGFGEKDLLLQLQQVFSPQYGGMHPGGV